MNVSRPLLPSCSTLLTSFPHSLQLVLTLPRYGENQHSTQFQLLLMLGLNGCYRTFLKLVVSLSSSLGIQQLALATRAILCRLTWQCLGIQTFIAMVLRSR